jgi:hypothetical protein
MPDGKANAGSGFRFGSLDFWVVGCLLVGWLLVGWLVGWLSVVGCLIVLDWFAEHLGRHAGRQDGCLLVVSLL